MLCRGSGVPWPLHEVARCFVETEPPRTLALFHACALSRCTEPGSSMSSVHDPFSSATRSRSARCVGYPAPVGCQSFAVGGWSDLTPKKCGACGMMGALGLGDERCRDSMWPVNDLYHKRRVFLLGGLPLTHHRGN